MRQFHKLEIEVSAQALDGSEQDSILVKNGRSTIKMGSLDIVLGLLPSNSEVQVIAFGTVNNETVHKLSNTIRNSHVFVTIDLSHATELSRVSNTPFAKNQRLRAIIFPCNLVYINPGALEDCTALEEVNIPQTVLKIGINAFAGCTNLKSIYFEDVQNWLSVDNLKQENEIQDLSNPIKNPSKFTSTNSEYYGCLLYKKA